MRPNGSRLGRAGPGLFAGLVVLAFAWSVAHLLPDVAFAPVSVAERLVRLAPGDAATLATGTACGILYDVVLDWLTAAVSSPQEPGRRRALTLAGASALGLLAGGWVFGSLLGPARGQNTAVRATKRLLSTRFVAFAAGARDPRDPRGSVRRASSHHVRS